MMKVLFYRTQSGRSPVREFIDNLPLSDQVRFGEVIDELLTAGLEAARLILKPIEGKLWEVKFKSVGGSYRVLYVLISKNEMVWLHAFKKKTQKTPKKEIELALSRMKEIL